MEKAIPHQEQEIRKLASYDADWRQREVDSEVVNFSKRTTRSVKNKCLVCYYWEH